MREKSLKSNMILNAIKNLMSIIFPLITFPYVSKILQVDNLGSYNFSNSIISYFLLLAGLGISSYAIREGARFRNDKIAFSKFANEMFTINIITTVIAYCILVFSLFIIYKFKAYESLIIVLSLQIIFKTIGIEWIYSIYEDYAYITIRSILFQILSLFLLFLLVKTKNDCIKYAIITVISSSGSNILNYFHSKKYCKVKLTSRIHWKRHLKPIMIIFSTSIAATIYVNSDMTILGFMCNNYSIGIYSVSVKIYTIVKTLLSSVLLVSIPRMSAYLGENKPEMFNKTARNILETLMTVMIPSAVGIIVLSRQIVLIISDISYIEAYKSLQLLGIALIFCMIAWFWGQCILLPLKLERVIFKATIISAIINIVLNFIMIPFWKQDAAAFTTVIGEGIAMIICMYTGRKYVNMSGIRKSFIKIVIGCLPIIIIAFMLKLFCFSNMLYTILTIVLSIIIYFLIEIKLKNEAIFSIINEFKKKVSANCK